jgi:hypothetical protein
MNPEFQLHSDRLKSGVKAIDQSTLSIIQDCKIVFNIN